MAKKKTTGGPRPRRTTEEDIKRRKEYKSRAERDRMWQRRTLIIFGVLIALSVIVLAYGILNDRVLKPNQPVTTVNGQEVSTKDFQARVRLLRWQTAEQIRQLYALVGGNLDTLQQYAGQQIQQLQTPALFGGQVLDQMEEELVIKQAAADRGITIDQAKVDQQVEDYMASLAGLTVPGADTPTPTTEPTITPTPLVSPTPSSTPLPTDTPTPLPTVEGAATEAATAAATEAATEESLTPTAVPTETLTPTPSPTLEPAQVQSTIDAVSTDFFNSAESASNVNSQTVRDLFYATALQQAVLEDIGKDVPTEQLQVNARHILFAFNPDNPQDPTPPTDQQKADAKARADAALEALQNGEPFADMAKALSNDTGSASSGGDLGWASPDKYAPEFADAVQNATLGEIVGPVETQFGYHIIQVNQREIRPLTASELSSAKQQAYQTWLDEQKAKADIKRNSDWINRVPDTPTYNELLGDILPIQ